uniref:Uncharacterized protein n=1 Tax=Tetranychus urticae TaxID=32264 RepID=T1KYC6_TETUR
MTIRSTLFVRHLKADGINDTSSSLDYTPPMTSSYLTGSGSQAYTSGTASASASPYWEYPVHPRPYPIDVWRHHRYDYWDPSHDLAYGRTDYYWLIPVAFIIGIGAILLPVFSLFFTAMVTTGTINLTAGRRKRSLFNEKPISLLVKEVQSAITRFGYNSQRFEKA